MDQIQEEKIRGNTIHYAKKAFEDLYGEQKYSELLIYIEDSKSKEILSQPILSSEWYNLEIYLNLLDAMEKMIKKEGIKKVNYRIAENQIKGFYALLAKFVSLESVQPKVNEMWKKQYSVGTLSAEIDGNNVHVSITEFQTNEIHAFSINSWIARFIEIISKKKVIENSYKFLDEKNIDFEFVLG